MYDFIVIGKGLMGSAALRYLSAVSSNVAIIGPDEPAVHETHEGIFSSHYDEGRLAGHLGKDITWAQMSARAIAQYPLIEEQSGIRFHVACGGLRVNRPDSELTYLANRTQIIKTLNLPMRSYADPTAISQVHPMLAFPEGYIGLFEPAPAGYINPRPLIRAQLAIAEQSGATIVREIAVHVKRLTDGWEVSTDSGASYRTRSLLLATGAFSNCFEVAPRKLALRIKGETTIHAQVPESEAKRLVDMPTVGYEVQSKTIDGIYMAPPIRYPDGNWYIKLGCDTIADQTFPDLESMQQWMRAGNSDIVAHDIYAALLSIIPGLQTLGYQSKRCLVTYTTHRKPYIDQLDAQLFVATGGNGASAHNSDTHGYLAAQLMTEQPWPSEFPRHEFAVAYADGNQ